MADYNWLEFAKFFREGEFDALLCAGNSLTMLFPPYFVNALSNFRHTVRAGGIVIVDERNYPRIMRELKEDGSFPYSYDYVYCGRDVKVTLEIGDGRTIRFHYLDKPSGIAANFDAYPFKNGELRQGLFDAGFSKVETFWDYSPVENENADFIIHVAMK